MAQSQNNDELKKEVAKLGRDLCEKRQECLDSFSSCIPLLRLWSRQARENFAKKNYRLTDDFETKNRRNKEKVSVTVKEARATYPVLLSDFQNQIERFLTAGQAPSPNELREINSVFLEFNPKFNSIRQFALQCEETSPAIRQLFRRYDEIRNSIVEKCASDIKKAAYSAKKRSLQESDREDLLADANLIAMIALDRYDAKHNGELQAFLACSVKDRTIDFMRDYSTDNEIGSIYQSTEVDGEGSGLAAELPDGNASSPCEIVEANELEDSVIKRIAKSLGDPDVRLFLRYRGVPDGNFNRESLNALLEGKNVQTTYKKLGEEESVTLQAIQKRCKRGGDIIWNAIGDLVDVNLPPARFRVYDRKGVGSQVDSGKC